MLWSTDMAYAPKGAEPKAVKSASAVIRANLPAGDQTSYRCVRSGNIPAIGLVYSIHYEWSIRIGAILTFMFQWVYNTILL